MGAGGGSGEGWWRGAAGPATGALLLGLLAGALAGRALWPAAGSDAERNALLRELAGREEEHMQEMSRVMREQMRAQQEAVLGQFFRLQAFRRFAQEGLETAWLVPVSGGEDDPWSAVASGRRGARVPQIAVDPASREGWRELSLRLEGLQGGVDERVHAAFRDVRAFIEGHPLPAGEGLGAARMAGWDDSEVVGRWRSLNRVLLDRATALLEEF